VVSFILALPFPSRKLIIAQDSGLVIVVTTRVIINQHLYNFNCLELFYLNFIIKTNF
jgi:hypothetical protein